MKYKVEILPQTPNALFTQRENGLTHSPFSLELALYTALKNGDEASMRLAMEDYFAAGFVIGRMSADSLRQMKFWAVSVIAIAIHYAILGGLDETDAYNLSDEYIRHIDGLFTIDDCMEYLSSRAIQLVRSVAESKKGRTLSPKIKACVHYIHIHLHEKLTVTELARHVQLSESYSESETGCIAFHAGCGCSLWTDCLQPLVLQPVPFHTMLQEEIRENACCIFARKSTGLSTLGLYGQQADIPANQTSENRKFRLLQEVLFRIFGAHRNICGEWSDCKNESERI